MCKKFKQKLITDMRLRATAILKLLDEIEAGKTPDPFTAQMVCSDVQTTAKYLKKHLFSQNIKP